MQTAPGKAATSQTVHGNFRAVSGGGGVSLHQSTVLRYRLELGDRMITICFAK